MHSLFKFKKTSTKALERAVRKNQFFGDFARVRENVCDDCFSVDYKDRGGVIINSNGLSLREANKLARGIEEYHRSGKTERFDSAPSLKTRISTFFENVER